MAILDTSSFLHAFQWERGYHPYPASLTAYPTSGKGYDETCFLFFPKFAQNDSKGCRNDYLHPLSSECRRFSTVLMKTGSILTTTWNKELICDVVTLSIFPKPATSWRIRVI